MIEKFCDIDSQVETKIKLRYQLFCEGEDQIYYSNDLGDLMKRYEKVEPPKVIYEVMEKYDNVVKLKTVVIEE